MPFQQVQQRSNESLEEAPDEWNFIIVKGRSGMKFSVNINPGPPVATFERSRDKVGKNLFEADGEYRCGPLSGYRIDYRLMDDYYCRFAMLEGKDFHMLVNVTMPLDQAGDLMPAVGAVLDSIRAI